MNESEKWNINCCCCWCRCVAISRPEIYTDSARDTRQTDRETDGYRQSEKRTGQSVSFHTDRQHSHAACNWIQGLRISASRSSSSSSFSKKHLKFSLSLRYENSKKQVKVDAAAAVPQASRGWEIPMLLQVPRVSRSCPPCPSLSVCVCVWLVPLFTCGMPYRFLERIYKLKLQKSGYKRRSSSRRRRRRKTKLGKYQRTICACFRCVQQQWEEK